MTNLAGFLFIGHQLLINDSLQVSQNISIKQKKK